MRHTSSILSIGPSDATCATGVTADALCMARLGAYPLTVISETCLRDTAHVEARLAVDHEIVIEQARLVLEDMPVAAIKLCLPASVALVATLAELVSDYSDVPLVLEAPTTLLLLDDVDEEPLAAAIELLLPQAAVLVAETAVARRLVAVGYDGDENDLSTEELAGALAAMGAEHVLLLGGRSGPQVVHLLHGADGVLRRDAFERAAHPVLGLTSSAAAAVAAALGQGVSVVDAVPQALRFAHACEAGALRLGMGAALPERRCPEAKP